MVAQVFNHSTWETEQVDFYVFKTRLVYIGSPRSANYIVRPCLKNKQHAA